MARLPTPGGDTGSWGGILNDFLSQAHNPDGTLKDTGLVATKYALPSTGIPPSDFDASTQTAISNGANAVQSINGKTGSHITLVPTDIGAPTTLAQLTDVSTTGATNTEVLTFNSSSGEWVAAPVSNTPINDATTGAKGIVQLTGDLGGTAAAPTVPGLSSKASAGRQIISGTGLSGGGDLTADRTLSVNYGTGAGTAAAGNDTRITGAEQTTNKSAASGYAGLDTGAKIPTTQLGGAGADSTKFLRGDQTWTVPPPPANATSGTPGLLQLTGDLGGTATSPTVPGLAGKAPTTRLISAGTGLSGGGDLSADRTLSLSFGTSAGTVAQGNDSRITSAEQAANKGAASGYAGLNSSTVVPTGQLGSGTASTTTYLRGDNTWTAPPTASNATSSTPGIVQLTGDLGGTATSPTVPNMISKATFTTKGDLLAGTGAGAVSRISIGTDSQVLKADSTQTAGVKWKQAPSVINVKDYGAVADCRQFTDAAITSGSTNLTSATAAFTNADVGKSVAVGNAGGRTVTDGVTNGTILLTSATANFSSDDVGAPISGGSIPTNTTIAKVNSATSVNLSSAAGSSATGVTVTITSSSLYTTVASVTNSTTAVLTTAAFRTVSGANAAIGTDNSTAFSNALAASRTAKVTCFIPAGSYAIAAQVANVSQSYGYGMDLQGDSRGQTRIFKFLDDGLTPLFSFTGGGAGFPTLTAQATAGSQTVTVSSSSGLVASNTQPMWFYMYDTSQPIIGEGASLHSTVNYYGEVGRIQAVNGTTITLKGMLQDTYAATTTTFFGVKPISGFRVRDIDFINPVPLTNQSGEGFFVLTACVDIVFERCRTFNLDTNFLYLQNSYNIRVIQYDFFDTHDNINTVPYMIALKGNTSHVLIDQCFQRNGRHMITMLASSSAQAPVQHVLVSNCICTENTNSPFDSHPGARHVTFLNCYVHNQSVIPQKYLNNSSSTNGIGESFKLRGPDHSVINCTVVGGFYGVSAYNGADRARILGNHLEGCDTGVYIQNVNDSRIEANEIINPRTNGVLIDSDTSGYSTTAALVKNNRVDGNPSSAAYLFNAWNNGFVVTPDNVAPSATTTLSGRSITTIASAATLTLPAWGDVFNVTGTTNISAMTANQLYHGRKVILRFAGALTMSSGTGLSLNSSFATATGAILSLFCDGTSWYELGRNVSGGRINRRVVTATSSATPTINTDNTDVFGLTAQAVAITSFTTNLTGTPVNGNTLWIYIIGTTSNNITWGSSFEVSSVALPTTITTNRQDILFIWNAATSKWRCVAVS